MDKYEIDMREEKKRQFFIQLAKEGMDYGALSLTELTKMAKSGDAGAQYSLGVLYQNGLGVAKDYTEAVKWYRFAAEQGFARAQYTLGLRCYNGEGVAQDYREAFKWYRLAAEQGYAYAQFILGVGYDYGQGVEKNYEQAYFWYLLAAIGNTEPHEAACVSRDFVVKKLTETQIAKIQKEAQAWMDNHNK